MKITTRRGAVAFFIVLGCALVAIAIALNITWIIHWRNVVPVAIGIVLFALIIAGLIVNTIFVVREIRRNEQYDSFLNAVTHELRTPVASIRLYLETLQSREVTDAQRSEFYRHMLVGHRPPDGNRGPGAARGGNHPEAARAQLDAGRHARACCTSVSSSRVRATSFRRRR